MTASRDRRRLQHHYHLLPQPKKARFNGVVYVLNLSKDDPIFPKIGIIDNEVKKKYNEHFFGFWDVNRSYTKKEIVDAKLFCFSINAAFEPSGEECGTLYDDTMACEICGANRKQVGVLKLKKGSIPKKDIARTIAGEVVVSDRLASAFKQRGLKGIAFESVAFGNVTSNYYQLIASSPRLELTEKTLAGHNPFNLSMEITETSEFTICGGYKVNCEKEVYRCPKGHTIGPRLLSEPYVFNTPSINEYDLLVMR